MKWITYLAIFALSITSCSRKNKVSDIVTATLKANNRFFSVFIDSRGELWVEKGNIKEIGPPSSSVSSREISRKVKIDSIDVFFKQIKKLKARPIKGATNIKDSPKTLVTYNGEIIYDAYYQNQEFWDAFRFLLGKFPKGFDPFDNDTNGFN